MDSTRACLSKAKMTYQYEVRSMKTTFSKSERRACLAALGAQLPEIDRPSGPSHNTSATVMTKYSRSFVFDLPRRRPHLPPISCRQLHADSSSLFAPNRNVNESQHLLYR
jgi:hypothetical protein